VRRGALAVLGATVLALAGGAVAAPAAGAHESRGAFPAVIPLPNGFQPEGIATGPGGTFYAGSLANGAIYRGSVVTGRGSVFIAGVEGSSVNGLEVSGGKLFAAGGRSGQVRVYDTRSGRLLSSTQVGAPGSSFVNDVVVTRNAAYFTDSLLPTLYVLPIGRNGRLGEVWTLPLTGDLQYATGFNANGIEASPDGRTLIVVQSNKGLLFTVSARTGVTREIDLGGASVTNGDGLLRRGDRLYVVRNQLNQIAVFDLGRGYRSARLVRTITDPDFQVPTTIDSFGPVLYAVNARFGTTPTPDTTYTVVRVDGR
jgi:sugar lactone lactonase YvrE